MRQVLAGIGIVALASTLLAAQSGTPHPSFDVADVHVRDHSSNPRPAMSGDVLRAGRYDLRNATMLNLISVAYAVPPETVVGGPNWLGRNRFDIIAKAPSATSQDDVRLMLQSLLADRFKLVLHKDTKPVPSYVLTVAASGSKLKAASGTDATPCQGTQNRASPTGANATLSCRSVSLGDFLDQLRGWGSDYITTRAVDATGLKGTWDIDLTWTTQNNVAIAGAGSATLFAALEQQLGLKLDFKPAPADVLVVDSVNDHPTENPSGVALNLPPPPPAEFDVADIKLSAPDAALNGQLQPGGRINLQGVTMRQLFTLAWEISDPELLAGAPKWFDTTRYSLVARTSALGNDNIQIDIDDVRQMLKALLVDRFKIATHVETRPVSASTLLADKPKLQTADPANRTSCFNGPAPGAKDPRDSNPILNRLVTCQNMTMAQLTEDLPGIAPGYFTLPLVDATGLAGAYDFTLSFTGAGRLTTPVNGAGGDASTTAAASAPNGALSLPDAIQRQLGLKVQDDKRPMPVLVIDRIEEQPSDN